MKNKLLYLIIAVQIAANVFTVIYSHANAAPLNPCGAVITATPTPISPTFAFNAGVIRRFPNPNNLVIYSSVHDKQGYQLDGFSLHFSKDGSAVAQVGGSTAYVQGLTHPPTIIGGNVITSSIPSFVYNLKAAFDPIVVGNNFTPIGTWTVVLQDADGQPASAQQSFVVIDSDPNMELFLDFTKN